MAQLIEFPSADQVRTRISYDPETGEFRWSSPHQGVRVGHHAGTVSKDGRREICVFGRRHKAGRLAWLLSTGSWPIGVIDHINGDPSDNRLCNLRDVPTQENIQNQRKAHSNNKSSGLLGVCRHTSTGKWTARILHGGKSVHLGIFESPKDASIAYKVAKRLLHKGCTI